MTRGDGHITSKPIGMLEPNGFASSGATAVTRNLENVFMPMGLHDSHKPRGTEKATKQQVAVKENVKESALRDTEQRFGTGVRRPRAIMHTHCRNPTITLSEKSPTNAFSLKIVFDLCTCYRSLLIKLKLQSVILIECDDVK